MVILFCVRLLPYFFQKCKISAEPLFTPLAPLRGGKLENGDAHMHILIIHDVLFFVELMTVGGLDGGGDKPREREQRQHVRHDHELIEHIRKLPDKLV